MKNILFLFFFFNLYGYTIDQSKNISLLQDNKMLSYSMGEFDLEAYYFRRGEIIFFGSFPLSYFFVNLIYELSKFIYDSSVGKEADLAIFGGTNRELNEDLGVILSSVGVSLIISIVDNVILRKKIKSGKIKYQ